MKWKQKTKAGGKLKHNFKRQARRQKGITLIALIITIVILIILATITINIAFGDNGLIKRAQQARDLYANESASELDVLNEVDEYLKEKIEKVTDMSFMFGNWDDLAPRALTEIIGLEEFNTSNVQYMDAMFNDCVNFTSIDVSNFNTEKVLWMDEMFNNCKALTSLDLSSFNTSNVEDMMEMFANCSALTEILVGPGWVDTQADKTDMFTGCKISEVTQKTV